MGNMRKSAVEVEAAKQSQIANPTGGTPSQVVHKGIKGFLIGPYFRIIPDPRTTKSNGADVKEDYMDVIQHLSVKRIDEDGEYGVEPEELVPLPFGVPKAFVYVKDMVYGCYQVVQNIVVILIAINLVTREQYWRGSATYRNVWHPLLMGILVLYTAVTQMVLILTSNELVIKKFMYYRLLSLRILVDWTNLPPHRGWFFYYFVATWGLMNLWGIYCIAVAWSAPGGAFHWALGAWGLINLQTLQLMFYYLKLLRAERNLVTLNKFVERAPAEAQKLIDYTYVVDESVLKDECFEFVVGAGKALSLRMINLLTCGHMGKKYVKYTRKSKLAFNLDRMKAQARNCQAVHEKLGLTDEHLRVGDKKDLYEEDDDVPEHRRKKLMGDKEDVEKATSIDAEEQLTLSEKVVIFFNYLPWYVYRKLYATCMALYIGFMPSRSWPFRPDVPYFQMMFVMNVITILVGVAVLVWGVFTGQYDKVCHQGEAHCKNCYEWTERYVGPGHCAAVYNITTTTVAGALEKLTRP